MEYSIQFSGKALPGFDQQQVRAAMGHALKLSDAKLDQLFQASGVTLKKGLSQEEAEKYAQFFKKIGADVRFLPPLPAPAAPDFSNIPDAGDDLQATIVVAPRARPQSADVPDPYQKPEERQGLLGKLFGIFK